jgi:hypothetical protein
MAKRRPIVFKSDYKLLKLILECRIGCLASPKKLTIQTNRLKIMLKMYFLKLRMRVTEVSSLIVS